MGHLLALLSASMQAWLAQCADWHLKQAAERGEQARPVCWDGMRQAGGQGGGRRGAWGGQTCWAYCWVLG